MGSLQGNTNSRVHHRMLDFFSAASEVASVLNIGGGYSWGADFFPWTRTVWGEGSTHSRHARWWSAAPLRCQQPWRQELGFPREELPLPAVLPLPPGPPGDLRGATPPRFYALGRPGRPWKSSRPAVSILDITVAWNEYRRGDSGAALHMLYGYSMGHIRRCRAVDTRGAPLMYRLELEPPAPRAPASPALGRALVAATFIHDWPRGITAYLVRRGARSPSWSRKQYWDFTGALHNQLWGDWRGFQPFRTSSKRLRHWRNPPQYYSSLTWGLTTREEVATGSSVLLALDTFYPMLPNRTWSLAEVYMMSTTGSGLTASKFLHLQLLIRQMAASHHNRSEGRYGRGIFRRGTFALWVARELMHSSPRLNRPQVDHPLKSLGLGSGVWRRMSPPLVFPPSGGVVPGEVHRLLPQLEGYYLPPGGALRTLYLREILRSYRYVSPRNPLHYLGRVSRAHYYRSLRSYKHFLRFEGSTWQFLVRADRCALAYLPSVHWRRRVSIPEPAPRLPLAAELGLSSGNWAPGPRSPRSRRLFCRGNRCPWRSPRRSPVSVLRLLDLGQIWAARLEANAAAGAPGRREPPAL